VPRVPPEKALPRLICSIDLTPGWSKWHRHPLQLSLFQGVTPEGQKPRRVGFTRHLSVRVILFPGGETQTTEIINNLDQVINELL